MGVSLEIYDRIFLYIEANPAGTEAALVADLRAAGYALADISRVGTAIYTELQARLVIRDATFAAVAAAFAAATPTQCLKVLASVRDTLRVGPFRVEETQGRLDLVSAALVDVTRQKANATTARAAIVSTFPDSQVKTDGLLIFDLGVQSLNAREAALLRSQEALTAEAAGVSAAAAR